MVLSLIPLVSLFISYEFYKGFLGIALIGLYAALAIAFINYSGTKKFLAGLKFPIINENRKIFDLQMQEVGLNPQDVNLLYAFSDLSIAKTVFNTVILDPFCWSDIVGDNNHKQVTDIIKKHILTQASEHKKKMYAVITAACTGPVQRFIFKHELGHLVDNYSYKDIFISSIITGITVIIGTSVGILTVPFYGISIAYIAAVCSGVLLDLTLSWFFKNFLFKSNKEIEADYFAARYSTPEEIRAASDFFELYEKEASLLRSIEDESWTDLSPRLFKGYPSSSERVRYLRKLAAEK
jgi:hypothetical protein